MMFFKKFAAAVAGRVVFEVSAGKLALGLRKAAASMGEVVVLEDASGKRVTIMGMSHVGSVGDYRLAGRVADGFAPGAVLLEGFTGAGAGVPVYAGTGRVECSVASVLLDLARKSFLGRVVTFGFVLQKDAFTRGQLVRGASFVDVDLGSGSAGAEAALEALSAVAGFANGLLAFRSVGSLGELLGMVEALGLTRVQGESVVLRQEREAVLVSAVVGSVESALFVPWGGSHVDSLVAALVGEGFRVIS